MELKRTALHSLHKDLGARLVPFAGWEMPVQYAGLLSEHKCVREQVGLFDVSHMGEFRISGRGSPAALSQLVTGNVAQLQVGHALYTLMCNEVGGIIDDVIVYRQSLDAYFICVNAANVEKDAAWVRERLDANGTHFENVSDFYAQIAVQGPLSSELLSRVSEVDLKGLGYYRFTEAKILGAPALVSRTGYTGELGYELYLDADQAQKVWLGLSEVGQDLGLQPCGLGARDTLRVEVGFSLYGQDMDDSTHPYESGLGWAVDLHKEGGFLGQEALAKVKDEMANPKASVQMRLTGFSADKGPVPRSGAELFSEETAQQAIGVVTSGVPSPTLGRRVGFCRVPKEFAKAGTKLWVDVRGRRVAVTTQPRVFYKDGTAKKDLI